MVLRDYQSEIIADVERGFEAGHNRQIIAAATGAGKTVIASALARRVAGPALVVVDRRVLIGQWLARLDDAGVIRRGRLPGSRAVVTTVQGLGVHWAALGARLERFSLVYLDEIHLWHRTHERLLAALPDAKVIGLTATPDRAGLGRFFTRLAWAPTRHRLIDEGHLVPTHCLTPEPVADTRGIPVVAGDFDIGVLSRVMRDGGVIQAAVQLWKRVADDQQTLAYCCDIAHAQAVAAAFRAAGVPAESLDHRAGDLRRNRILQDFEAGRIRVVASVNMLGVGFDSPAASCGLMLRPTLSKMLFVQMAGRLGRPNGPAKRDALLIDPVENVLRHGRPDDYVPPRTLSRAPTGHEESTAFRLRFLRECMGLIKRRRWPIARAAEMYRHRFGMAPDVREWGAARRRPLDTVHTLDWMPPEPVKTGGFPDVPFRAPVEDQAA